MRLSRLFTFPLLFGTMIAIGLALFAPQTALAANLASFAGCTGTDCSACNMVSLANGLIEWFVGFLFLLFAVVMAVAGFGLVTAGGNRGALDNAKSKFINAIIGIIIVLAAWLIVDTLMRAIVGQTGHEGELNTMSGWLFWGEVQCQVQTEPRYEEFEVEEYFQASGVDSYQVFTYNTTQSCRMVVNQSFPNMTACRSALSSVMAGGQSYIVQDCDGAASTAPLPTWSTAPVCGGVPTTSGGGMTLSLRGGGTAAVLPCEAGAADRVTINFLNGSAHVHRNLAPSLRRIDAAWRARGGDNFYRVYSVGGYNCRNIRGSSRLSVHAYGLALDINPGENGQGPTLVTDMPPDFVQLFRNEGWGWGGNWSSSKDAMHFSKASNEGGNMQGE